MDPDQLHRLLRGLFAAGDVTPPVRERAARAVADAPDSAAVGDRLSDLGLLTRYQAGKLRNGRLSDILFGPYLICEKIGEGGMGKVYRAVHREDGTQVALKVVRPHLMANAVVQKRYAREAKAAASFDHPNIIKLLAEDTVEGRYYLAMEYIDGVDLSRLVREFGRPPDRGLADHQEAAEYIRQAALGLQHAHDRGFVHRDVKPSNLLAYGDRPLPGTEVKVCLKLLDMGLVRRLMGADDEASRSELTRDGTVVGTPDYMSPEQAKNSSTVDGRADLYSLGCTLFFLLHGRPPFDGGSPIDKLLKHHTEEPPDPRTGRPDVPVGLAQVIQRLLKKNPAERYQAAAAVADALRPFCPGGAPAPSLAPVEEFSLAPVAPAVAPVAEAVAAPAPRSLRLKVREPARVPHAVDPGRADVTPSGGTPTAPVRRPADRTPSNGQPARTVSGRPPGPPTTDRLARDATPTPGRTRRSRRSSRKRRPVWPVVASAVAAVLVLGMVTVLIVRGPSGPPTPTEPTRPGPGRDPAPAVGRPATGSAAVADGANAVVQLRPAAVRSRLPTEGSGRLARFQRELARSRFDPTRLDRVTVSVVGGSPAQAVAVGEPASGGTVVIGTDPAVTDALAARQSAGRPAAGLSADLLAALGPVADAAPVRFAADGGFTLPTGDTLAAHRVRWASATAAFDGDDVVVALTLAGPDRPTLLDFVNLELATKLQAAVPAMKPLCDRLAAADPSARRTDAGLEMTFPVRVPLAELLAVVEQLVPAGE